ncbi:MAG: YARHG domain-containing protein [Bacteroidetes bacterium]|nr:YARHG domain-containing protein [Bacteroidota bacterium]
MSQSGQTPVRKKKNNQMQMMGILIAIIVVLTATVLIIVLSNSPNQNKPGTENQSARDTAGNKPGTQAPETVYVEKTEKKNGDGDTYAGTLPGKYPEVSLRELTFDDIRGKHVWEVILMRNEVYARYGYKFKLSWELKDHFNSQPWYTPRYDNVDQMLTPLEKKNVNFLVLHTPKYDINNIKGSNTYVR